jgi:hypothetical protein
VNLEDADVTGADFTGATLTDSSLSGTNFSGAILRRATISNVTAYGAVFDNADLTGAIIANCTMSDASFRRVTAHNAALENVVLFRADLSDADFTKAAWGEVRGQDTNLTGVEFTGVKFRYVNLQDANLNGKQARQIIGDKGFAYDTLPHVIRYNQLSFDEANEELALDKEEFTVLMWLGEVEVRDNHTGALVTSDFDPENHHVPAWAVNAQQSQQQNDVRPEQPVAQLSL